MKYKIIGSIVVVLVLIALYVLTSGGPSSETEMQNEEQVTQ